MRLYRRINMSVIFQSFSLFLFIISVQSQFILNDTSIRSYEKSDILSRRKRFIIFPEGSSFQLVFCLTYPAVFEIGDIFLWGVTAALAWELPQDPYSPFNHHADPLHRRMDSKVIYYTAEDGRIIHKRPYTKKFIVNPAFAKRSADASPDDNKIKKEKLKQFKIVRKQMHASKNKRDFLKSETMEQQSVEFHRSSRASLYQKIEAMLQGLGVNGKECLLKTLCKVGKIRDHPHGSFLQEILRVTFTLPKGSSSEDYKEYDKAHSSPEFCDKLYPDCEEHLKDPVLTY